MTRINLKVKIHVVDELFAGAQYRTAVWVSEAASEVLEDFVQCEEGKRFLKKLKYYAEAGFVSFEGRNGPIRHEWDGVLRIGHSSTLFRLIGFYETKDSFAAIDAFHKRGQRLSSAERSRIDEVARVKKHKRWGRRARA